MYSHRESILAFEQLGAKIEGVLVDNDGMRVDLLEGQNPMGFTFASELMGKGGL
ncbi:hypothetical protein [Thermococcus sp. MV5]|uniref:hypothetical protein n=1 Tax=Thermococcus sp. MV5 TaxID=1638272 RepID=UPI001F0DFCC6|nr:hypothetical protein [Thermococcus sp. MV5]